MVAKKNTANSFILVNFHFKIVSEFRNCLFSRMIFPEAKLMLKQNVFFFYEIFGWLYTSLSRIFANGECTAVGR